MSSRILTDNETKIDLLNNEAIAKTIVSLLRDKPGVPVTIGVHGDWGAGKSSILEMIEAEFEGNQDILCLKFNGWRFQGFEDAKIALIEGIVTSLIEKRPALAQAGDYVKETFRRIDWLKVAKKAGSLALTAYTGVPTPGQIDMIVKTLGGMLSDPSKLATKENITLAIESVQGLIKPAETKHVPEEINEFRKAFDELLKKAKVQQLIVLIDDLDRCLPDTAIETLEAVRLFVFTANTAFVVAADEAMIEYSVRKHFPDLPDTTGPRDYARNYLEKLIQIPFRIPALGETETRIYVTLLLAGAVLDENSEGFKKLILLAREHLKRPWTSGSLDISAVKKALGAEGEQIKDALVFSDQIGSVLASGSRGNPRQIKRFLNTLLLRQKIAEARGFGSDISVPTLAKLMLAERFLQRFFDQIAHIAANNSNGKCADLKLLESAARGKNEIIEKKQSAGEKQKTEAEKSNSDSVLLSEWMSSSSYLSWAKIDPIIGDTDLRPYLFITKDRKDYFYGSSALGHLSGIVERLLGPKLAVQGMETELRKLSSAEAGQIFDALTNRIISTGSLDKEPDGVQGLSVLVKAHSVLQSNLVSFLEGLPPKNLGAWATTGWTGIISTSESVSRFEKLQTVWLTNGSTVLKATVNATIRTRGK